MRGLKVAGVAALIVVANGCSSELAQRPLTKDPTSVAATEAPFRAPPVFDADPLLGAAPSAAKKNAATVYVCPMHPAIERKEPGVCPICGMTLVPKEDSR